MPRMAPAPTMWPSEVPASSLSGGQQAWSACMGALRRAGRRARRAHQVMPKDSTISSCGVPLTSDLPWMLLRRRWQAGLAAIGHAGELRCTRSKAHRALQLRGTAPTRMRAGVGRGARRRMHMVQMTAMLEAIMTKACDAVRGSVGCYAKKRAGRGWHARRHLGRRVFRDGDAEREQLRGGVNAGVIGDDGGVGEHADSAGLSRADRRTHDRGHQQGVGRGDQPEEHSKARRHRQILAP